MAGVQVLVQTLLCHCMQLFGSKLRHSWLRPSAGVTCWWSSLTAALLPLGHMAAAAHHQNVAPLLRQGRDAFKGGMFTDAAAGQEA